MLAEQCETLTGSRLHVNATVGSFPVTANASVLPEGVGLVNAVMAMAVVDLLLNSVTAVRVAGSRLLGNLIVTSDSALASTRVTGPMFFSIGITDTADEDFQHSSSFTSSLGQ